MKKILVLALAAAFACSALVLAEDAGYTEEVITIEGEA